MKGKNQGIAVVNHTLAQIIEINYICQNSIENALKIVRIVGSGNEVKVGKVFCLGRNYSEHAREMDAEVPKKPVVFMKPATAVIGNREPIRFPSISKMLHHEVELVAVIGKGGKAIPSSRAREHILGYAVGLDMTLRDLQEEAKKKGLPWTVSKGFDTSAPVSPVVPVAKIPDPANLTIVCRVNGIVRQQGSTSNMIFSLAAIIEYISSIFTLEEGDLIFTGTPEGVGQVFAGDTVEAELLGYTKTIHTVEAA